MKLAELRQTYGELVDQRKKMADQAEDEDRDFDESEKKVWDETGKQLDELKTRIARAEETEREQRDASRPQGDPIRPTPEGQEREQRQARRRISDLVIDSEQYRRFIETNGPRLASGDIRGVQHMSPVNMPGVGVRALVTLGSDTSAGALVTPMDTGIIVEPGRRDLTIFDLITIAQTGTDTVEFVRVTAETNAAEVVPEASALTGTSGTKPESALALERVSESVKTIAHWMATTTRALSDAPQMRAMIENWLRYGLREALEEQIMTGDGTGEDFVGIAETPNIQTQSFEGDLYKTARIAKRKVRTVGRVRPTGYVLHPEDAEAVDLMQDNEGRYYYGGPRSEGPPTLWGLPIVESEVVEQGTGYVADWRMAVLWDREQPSIATGTVGDDFIRNIIRILAELRAAFGVLKPTAFVEFDTEAGG